MNHTAYILPAYAITIAGLLGILIQSALAMRRAEAQAVRLKSQRRQ